MQLGVSLLPAWILGLTLLAGAGPVSAGLISVTETANGSLTPS